MVISFKMYKEKRKELVKKIDEYSMLANEAAMLSNWMEYSKLNKVLGQLRNELAKLDGRTIL